MLARDATGLPFRDDNRTKETTRLTGDDHTVLAKPAEDQMTKTFHATIPGPHEAQLRRRIAEMRADGVRYMRVRWTADAIHMSREERCAAIVKALDAPACPVYEFDGRVAA